MLAASALTMVACTTATDEPRATVTETSSSSSASTAKASSAAKPAPYVTLPDVYGENAEVAKTKLEDLGLTKVELVSSNAKYSTVDQPKDWKVVAVEPGAGTVVKSDQPVIVRVVKVQ